MRLYVPLTATRTTQADCRATYSGINQSNLKERSRQVAKMRQIYEDGSRVVVFLGEDFIDQPTESKFPTYTPLDQN
jgi:hypothetical protein